MPAEKIARRAQPTRTPQRPSRPWVGPAGWALSCAALALVGYVVVAVTLGAGFEHDLAAAAEHEGVAVNAVATSTQARITHDHALYALITGLFLLLPPAFLLRAAGKIRTGVGGRLVQLTWWAALSTLIVWWSYVGLGLGLFADPENLPPLVRDFGPLTVPVVSALSLLALGSLVLASEAVRRVDVARRAARLATVVSILLGALSLAALPATGFEDPVAPIVIVPGALILGIALLRAQRRPPAATGAMTRASTPATPHHGPLPGASRLRLPRHRPAAIAMPPLLMPHHKRWRLPCRTP